MPNHSRPEFSSYGGRHSEAMPRGAGGASKSASIIGCIILDT